MKTILDLCAGSGNWSRPYLENGYRVLRFDLPDDIRLIQKLPETIHGILAAPPCTAFARSGAWVKRTPDEMKLALSVVDACLRAIVVYRPVFWALENPVGMLHRWIGKPSFWFHPCDYGDPYTKKTGLWGNFNPPVKAPVPSVGSITDLPGLKSSNSKVRRAETPLGFAYAFFKANP